MCACVLLLKTILLCTKEFSQHMLQNFQFWSAIFATLMFCYCHYMFNWCQAWTHTESATLPKTAKIFLLFIYTRLNCSSCGLDNYTCMPVHSLTLKKKKSGDVHGSEITLHLNKCFQKSYGRVFSKH